MRKPLFLFLTLTLALSPAASFAKGALSKTLIPQVKPIVLTYDVYVGGVHLLTADALFEEGNARYRVRFKGATYGFWNRLFRWQTELDAQGRIARDHFVPVEFEIHDLWGKKTKMSKLVFGKGDIKASYDPPEPEDKTGALTPAQKQGALDPMTAMLQMLAHVAVEKDCNVTVPVFDGKRRFDIIGADAGTASMDDSDYNVYKGDARVCDAKFRAVAGEWTEKVKAGFWKKADNGEDREPFHIWLASLAPGLPELAVRVETGSAFGDIIVHLSAWHYADRDEVKALAASGAAKK